MVARLALGAPGIYELPEGPIRTLTGVPMDVAAFVGVAPRGPARLPVETPWVQADPSRRRRTVPVAVESIDEYQRLFGGFEGEGLLPYAVASFFEQGGRRAWIARIVHDYGPGAPANDGAVAQSRLRNVTTSGGAPIRLRARSEGSWGNELRTTLRFVARPLQLLAATSADLKVLPDEPLPAGSLLRLTLTGGTRLLRWASVVDDVPRTAARGRDRIVILDRPAGSTPERAEIIDGTLVVEDADPRFTRAETHEHVGLAAGHPRWLADVLVAESELLLPHPTWSEHELQPAHAALADAVSGPFRGGRDRDDEITPDDFFDPEWTLGDEEPRDGVHALVGIGEISTVVVPDLYSPGPLAPIERIVEPVTLAGPGFQICVDPPTPPDQRVGHPQLLGLMLDPELPSDLKRITGLQQRLVELADLLHSFVVLLDVPPRIGQQAVLRWRTSFASSYAAAYHPWLRVARPDDEREETIRLNPTAVAAGLIARRERLSGVPYGPFNEIAANVVDVVDRLSPARHDELHPLGINVFLRERDGVRLTAGRTLSRDPDYRQLSIRRLMTMLARTLEREAQWMVFEPNNESLQASVKHLLEGFLAQLYEANAFVGASPAEAFFVRCDETLNTQPVLDAGQLIVEIGVAPAEPLEFLVLRLARDGNGTVRVEAPGG